MNNAEKTVAAILVAAVWVDKQMRKLPQPSGAFLSIMLFLLLLPFSVTIGLCMCPLFFVYLLVTGESVDVEKYRSMCMNAIHHKGDK